MKNKQGPPTDGLLVRVPPAEPADYPVILGSDIWPSLPVILKEHCPAFRYIIITDSNVGELYGDEVASHLRRAGITVDELRFEAGEVHKTRESWATLTDELLALGAGRDSAVLALGGGVVGDLGGFVAATFMRGIPYVQLPTSLLAMIDSSVGGKTGVDTAGGKNLVGSFYPPRAVVADITTLQTLPQQHLRDGIAEAIKHGAIANEPYFSWIEASLPELLGSDPHQLEHLVRESVRIKSGIVARDEREAGPRKLLNFGHTIGHAIESVSEFEIGHGDAVSIGMMVEARIGVRLGITEPEGARRLFDILNRAGLPISVPGTLNRDAILDATRSDKKSLRGRVEYVMLDQIGGATWGRLVDDTDVRAALAEE